jgi:luciferase family oxidoreductase group 1
LRFAFAHHIQPWQAVPALRFYHENFKPSADLKEPQSLIAVSVVCAETDQRAQELARPLELTLLRFRLGKRARLPTIAEAIQYPYTQAETIMIRESRERFFVGSPAAVKAQLTNLAKRTGTYEIMVTTMIHDHADRRRSYELLADAFGLLSSSKVGAAMQS